MTKVKICGLSEMKHALEAGKAGTSSIAHINHPKLTWNKCDDYGHDWAFIKGMCQVLKKYKKINNTGYLVRHIPHILDN